MKYLCLFLLFSLSFSVNAQGYQPGYAYLYVYDFEDKTWFEENKIKKCVITSEIKIVKTEKGYKKDPYGDDSPVVETIQLKKTSTAKIYYYSYGKDKETYTYNNADQLVNYVREDEDEYTISIDYTYNSDGLMTSLRKYRKGKLDSEYTLVYDEKDRLIEEKSYTKGMNFSGQVGFSNQRIVFTYDDKDRIIEAIKYDSDEKERDHSKISYKEEGKRIEITQKSGYLTEFVPEQTYVFDDKGNEIEVINYDFYGKLDLKFVYKYNSNNQVEIFEKYNEQNKLSYAETSTYNEQNDLLKVIRTGFSAEEQTYEYVYDQNGQWTEQVENEEGIYAKLTMIKRKITYAK